MLAGTAMAASSGFKSPIYQVHLGHTSFGAYAAIDAFVINIAIGIIATLVLDAVKVPRAVDETIREDYEREEADLAAAAD